jgi:hypothetical protein
MARAKTRKKSLDPLSQADPRAPLDGQVLLGAAGPVLRQLEEDLLLRARDPAMTRALSERHAEERDAKRTADPFEVWQRAFVEQVAAAWFLSCVFVRTLEDRGLVERRRLAGPGAADSQRSFFELAPSLTERDYLLTVFRELEHFEATRDLFDSRHNPVWLLAPSGKASKALLALFRQPSAEEPAFRFGGADTRFLGDLYQDLSESVRSRYALLQTPRFVEAFILDRTLEPAIERFGLDQTTIIDPTCGSGHFLLGAFERFFDHKLRAEPGLTGREAARWALGAVHGVDINPYAVAIARFRLTLAFLEKAGYGRLSDAPAVHLNLAVADSLLENPGTPTLATLAGQRPERWFGAEYSLEEPGRAREILGKRHAAVVGNPPYITVKDAAKRELYRAAYPRSAAGKYSVAAPFTECFFQLARAGGRVGMITANSFMKREFGKRLIQEYLPTVNLDRVINTSGAFIPGHGTPTVLLFGSAEERQGTEVEVVLASRGEPSTPEDPEKGLVWSSIAEHWNEIGFENEYISVARVDRTNLEKHPWSLGGGGAAELKELLEERAEKRLGDVVDSIGIASFTLEDDVYLRPVDVWARQQVPTDALRPMVTGEMIRDWSVEEDLVALFPYDQLFRPIPGESDVLAVLWPWRTVLANNKLFGGKTKVEGGLKWYEFGRLTSSKLRTPLTITFAEVATHNHFVLDRGGKVFNRTAPIIKLPESATEEDHLALLAYLNSSTACFWMKQVCHNKTNASQKHTTDPARCTHAFSGTALESLPCFLPAEDGVAVARRLTELGTQRARWLTGAEFIAEAEIALTSMEHLQRFVRDGWIRYDELTARAAYLQEELDWLVYEQAGLLDPGEAQVDLAAEYPASLGTRPFEAEAGYIDGVSQRARGGERGEVRHVEGPVHWKRRKELLRKAGLDLIEDRAFKRMWRDTEQNVDQREFRQDLPNDWILGYAATALESLLDGAVVVSAMDLERRVHTQPWRTASEWLGLGTPGGLARRILEEESVPFLDAHVYTSTGLEKRAAWRRTWEAQRREDERLSMDALEVPPAYSQGSRGKSSDFRDARYWRLRGKLDVPKERFISYPGCESDEDGQPIYGWAGWNHLQRAQALAALYQDRKTREGWEKARLVPMLAGLLELIPWVKQWHNEPSAEFNGLKLGDYFEGFLKGECAELGVTEENLRAWPQRGAKSETATSKDEPTKSPRSSPDSASTKPRRRRQKPPEDQ